MRRRSVRLQYLIGGVVVILVVSAGFLGIFIPLERRLVDIAAGLVAGGSGLVFEANTGAPWSSGALILFGRHADEFQDLLFINQSLPIGTRVVDGDALVGFIAEAGTQFSKVRLLTSPGMRVNAVFETSGIPVELVGKGASILEVELPKGSPVRTGERVYFADDPAISIGTVARVYDMASEPFLKITVLHNINLTTLSRVGVF